jgi:hypothetical protein
VREFSLIPADQNAEETMLSHCANPRCAKPFLRLREGKLFLVETEPHDQPGEMAPPPFLRARPKRRVERYWLCDRCAIEWTLIYDRERGILLAPARRPVASGDVAPKVAFSEVVLNPSRPDSSREKSNRVLCPRG